MPPTTKFTQSGEVTLAYQVEGEGPLDLLMVPGFISHLEQTWEEPAYARFLQQLSAFSRLIMFDKRGTGLSDRQVAIPTLEQRLRDMEAVMEATGSRKTALFAVSEGGPASLLFAATHPERVKALIIYGSVARLAWSEDYPSGVKLDAEWDTWLEGWRKNWGAAYAIEHWAPSMAHEEQFRLWWAKYLRFGASPNAVIDLFRMNAAIDVRDILSAIHVPTLVVHRARDRAVNIAHGRFLAERIKGAKFVELSGEDHLWWVGDSEAIIHEVQEFLTGERQVEPDRVLATVFFTDIVNSTKRAAMMGDRRWRDLLDNHNTLLAAEIERFGGRVVKSMGDGILATFDSPAQAIQCAQAATREVQKLGIEIRVGLHTGEVELIAGDVGGIVVHTAARVLEQARPNEVWTSRTVKDLVAGSNLKFADRGTHQLKGISGDWPLFAVEP